MTVCPECHVNEVPAPWMRCLPCCYRLVAEWKAGRDAPAAKGPAAPVAIRLCAGVTVSGNLQRCGKRADQSGICKKHRDMIALGIAVAT